MPKLYQNEVGVAIDLDTKLPVATLALAQTQTIEVKLPDATTTSWTADIIADTSKIRHVIISGQLAQTGEYLLQAKLTFAGGTVVRGDTVSVTVFPNFE